MVYIPQVIESKISVVSILLIIFVLETIIPEPLESKAFMSHISKPKLNELSKLSN